MRVVFLSSPCFGYVHTYAFEPVADSTAAAPVQPATPAAVADTKAPQVPTDSDPLFAQLAAWVQRLTEESIRWLC